MKLYGWNLWNEKFVWWVQPYKQIIKLLQCGENTETTFMKFWSCFLTWFPKGFPYRYPNYWCVSCYLFVDDFFITCSLFRAYVGKNVWYTNLWATKLCTTIIACTSHSFTLVYTMAQCYSFNHMDEYFYWRIVDYFSDYLSENRLIVKWCCILLKILWNTWRTIYLYDQKCLIKI